jgi:hypothetical protein
MKRTLTLGLLLSACQCGTCAHPPAAIDAGGASAPGVAAPQLDAQPLLNEADVSGLLPPGKVTRQRLPGVPRTENYDSVRLSSGRDLGVAVQWWHYGTPAEAQARFQKDSAGYGPTKTTDEVGTHAFRAQGYQQRVLVFLDEPSRSVVAVTCSDQACPPGDETRLALLAHLVQSRLPRAAQ